MTIHEPTWSEVLDRYEGRTGTYAERANPDAYLETAEFDLWQPHLTHAQWMIENMPPVEKPEKRMRWLCFVQGVLWAAGCISIDDAKSDNYRILNGGNAPMGEAT